MRLLKTTLAASVLILMQGCAGIEMTGTQPVKPKAMPEVSQDAPAVRSFVRISTPKHQLLNAKTRVNRQGISIADALMAPKGLDKVQIVAEDSGVDLSRRVDLRVSDMTIDAYLKHLGVISNYDFKLDVTSGTPVINVASMIMKKWNLSAMSHMPKAKIAAGLSATISAGVEDEDSSSTSSNNNGTGSGTNVVIDRNDDTWGDTLAHAKDILGVVDQDEQNATGSMATAGNNFFGSDNFDPSGAMMDPGVMPATNAVLPVGNKAWLVANRRLGTVTGYGKPNDIKRLDNWLSGVEKEISRQVFLDVAIMDVTTAKGDGYGVDWSAVYNNSGFVAGDTGVQSIGLSGGNSGSALSIVDGGAWAMSAVGKVGSVTLNTLINALSEEGSVTLQSQPKMTVTNGYTAYLGATEEISYISDIEILPVDSSGSGGSDSIVTTSLSRVSVGLKLAMTPRIQENGDILVEVVPVLSSIKGFTDINSGGEVISTPNIAIQELSTQVITQSGKPIHLGGLILSRVIENAKRLPLGSSPLAKKLGELLGGMTVEEEGKELLIVITPTEVGT